MNTTTQLRSLTAHPHKRSAKRSRRGFSLIEILVVIGVIAIISAGIFSTISGTDDDARLATKQNNAAAMNRVLGNAIAAGATVSDIGGDASDAASIIAELDAGITVGQSTYSYNGTVTPDSYVVTGTFPDIALASDGVPTTAP